MRVFILLSVVLLILPVGAVAQRITVHSGALRLQNDGAINLPGDFTVNGALTCATGTAVRFNGTGMQQIAGSGTFSFYNLQVIKTSGDVVLATDVAVAASLKLTAGDVDLNGHTVDLGSTGILLESPLAILKGTAGAITATRTLDAPANDNVANLGAEITSAANLGPTQITRGHTIQTDGANQSIARYFDITPTTNTGLDATLVFHYDESELGGASESALRLFRSIDGGTSWSEEGGLPNAGANTVTLPSINAFSRWTLAGAGLLPVELVAFEAQVDGADVVLTWATASETNNAGFEVQRRDARDALAAGDWAVLAFVEGAGSTLEAQSYRHRIEGLVPGRHVFRLKQIDFDGVFEYSPEVEVFVELPEAYLLTPPYPNPFNPEARFSLMVKRRQQVEVSVYDALGRRVQVLYAHVMEAEQARAFVFDAGDLPSGLYLVQVVGETFVATRTVMLIR